MKIGEVIKLVNGLKPNQYTDEQKIAWLSECDSAIWKNIISTHEKVSGMPETFYGYTADINRDTELLAPAPHDVIYRYLLEMNIDLYNKEVNNYNNTSRLYNNAYSEFAAWWNRTYMPLSRVDHFTL